MLTLFLLSHSSMQSLKKPLINNNKPKCTYKSVITPSVTDISIYYYIVHNMTVKHSKYIHSRNYGIAKRRLSRTTSSRRRLSELIPWRRRLSELIKSKGRLSELKISRGRLSELITSRWQLSESITSRGGYQS